VKFQTIIQVMVDEKSNDIGLVQLVDVLHFINENRCYGRTHVIQQIAF
jgi:hypothetical protein